MRRGVLSFLFGRLPFSGGPRPRGLKTHRRPDSGARLADFQGARERTGSSRVDVDWFLPSGGGGPPDESTRRRPGGKGAARRLLDDDADGAACALLACAPPPPPLPRRCPSQGSQHGCCSCTRWFQVVIVSKYTQCSDGCRTAEVGRPNWSTSEYFEAGDRPFGYRLVARCGGFVRQPGSSLRRWGRPPEWRFSCCEARADPLGLVALELSRPLFDSERGRRTAAISALKRRIRTRGPRQPRLPEVGRPTSDARTRVTQLNS